MERDYFLINGERSVVSSIAGNTEKYIYTNNWLQNVTLYIFVVILVIIYTFFVVVIETRDNK